MMTYLLFKMLHLLSMLLLLGVGAGSAYYKYITDKEGSLEAIVHINRQVVKADWFFTTPAVILQPVTGFALVYLLEIPLMTWWLLISVGLYIFAGIFWIWAVYLQVKMRDLSIKVLEEKGELPAVYYHYARRWFYLGIPSFLAMFGIVVLMVFKSTIV